MGVVRGGGALTRTNSIGVFSPRGLDADTLVAGNAFGTILTAERFRGLEMTTEEIVTANVRAPVSTWVVYFGVAQVQALAVKVVFP